MKTGAVIAAAGMSSRMNAFKPMLAIGGETSVRRIIAAFREAGVETIVLVTGNQAERLEAHVSDLDVVCLRNEAYATTQMLDSAKIGLSYLKDKCSRIFFTPVDIPLFSAGTVKTLLHSGAMIALPSCKGNDGHPLLLDGQVVEKLLAYTGNAGLKGAVDESGYAKQKIEVSDEGVLMDMDTPEDYARLLNRHKNHPPSTQ